MDVLYRMKAKKLFKLLDKAREKEFDETAWEYWLTLGAEVQQKQPFPQYLSKLKKGITNTKSQDNRSDEEIIEDAENILQLMKRT